MELNEMKEYLRITYTDEDALISAQIQAATQYLKGKTSKTLCGETAIDNDELFKQAVKLLVAHWYEERHIIAGGTLSNIDHTVDAIIQHISCCGDYS
jgi:uncharacterized phage protein (predicted DNA packaging)